jgi:hypothetical protein
MGASECFESGADIGAGDAESNLGLSNGTGRTGSMGYRSA